MTFCGSDKFHSQDALGDDVYNAAAADLALEPFTNEEAFLAQVRAAQLEAIPPGYKITSAEVTMMKRPGPPCALMSAEATPTTASMLGFGRLPIREYARFCYDSPQYPRLGYVAVFAHTGKASEGNVREMAMLFFDGVNAAR